MPRKDFYSQIPMPGRDGMMGIRSHTPRTVISIDLMHCAMCDNMHPVRMQVMAVAPQVDPRPGMTLDHSEGEIVSDPNDPNNFIVT